MIVVLFPETSQLAGVYTMKMFLQPNAWSCLPASVCMVTGCSFASILAYVGHDGSTLLYPDCEPPMDRRSFSVQEMIDFCLSIGWLPVTIWEDTDASPLFSLRIGSYLQKHNAILLGGGEKPHAVAWCYREQLVYNPVGYKSRLDEFELEYVILFPETRHASSHVRT